MFDRLEPQIEGTFNEPTYQITCPKLANMRRAMRRKEESMKYKKLRQQIQDNMELTHVSEIDDSNIPRSKKRMAKFNVEIRMKTLRITIDNKGRSTTRMIKPFTKARI